MTAPYWLKRARDQQWLRELYADPARQPETAVYDPKRLRLWRGVDVMRKSDYEGGKGYDYPKTGEVLRAGERLVGDVPRWIATVQWVSGETTDEPYDALVRL